MKNFFKDVLKRFAVTLVSSLLFAIFSIVVVVGLLSSLVEEGKVEHEEESILTLNLSMNLTDRPSGVRLEDLTRQALTDEVDPPQLHLWEVLKALEKAQSDPKVKALFIRGGFIPSGYGCGYATIHELLKGIQKFKSSKKPVIGYARNPSQLDYLVYSSCDQLNFDPSGTLLLNGLSSESVFLGEAFEKYGVGMQVVRTGDFKGAVEPFTSTKFSEENRRQINRLINQRWQDYMVTISQNRGLEFSGFQNLLQKKYLFQPEEALSAGLIDSILPFDQMIDRLIEIGSPAEESGFNEIDFVDYLDRPDSSDLLEKNMGIEVDEIAVVYVEGSIVDGWGDDGLVVGGHEIADRLQEIREDDNCRAVVLRINSPGGSVSGSDAILQEIRRLRSEGTPVVVSMGSVAASGGYWIATECDHLIASEQTITGSIGVFGLLPNLKEFASKYGVYWDAVKTHPHSDLMGISRPKSEAEIKVIQTYVDQLYGKFIRLVAKARGIPENKVNQLAEGRVWSGFDAKRKGLVDEFGGLRFAIEKAAEIAGLGQDYEVVEIPEVETPMQAIEEIFAVSSSLVKNRSSTNSSFQKITSEIEKSSSFLQTLNDPRNVYGLLPWYRRGFGFAE